MLADAPRQPLTAPGIFRDGVWVVDVTGLLDLSPGRTGRASSSAGNARAQLRFTDLGGHQFTGCATRTGRGQLADLELSHRRRARCEDRIRGAKDTNLRNRPLKGFGQNQLW
jgi:hypothetical protein